MNDAFIIRLLDCLIAILLLVVTSPLLILGILISTLAYGSPLFFQTRLGRSRARIVICKIRTMPLATSDIQTHLLNWPDLPLVFRIIRAIKIDELPQLVSVLKGTLSLVGPRPGLVNDTRLDTERRTRNVYKIRPGITGISQIRGLDMSLPDKLAESDSDYVNNYKIDIYLKILVCTFLYIFGVDTSRFNFQ